MSKIAFLFPGQGSQYVGMGKDLWDNFKVARETFEEADEALQFKLSKIFFEGPEEELRLTINTQPAILTVSMAALRVLQLEIKLSPSLLAGHSLGEYSALVTAGALDFADAVRTVRARGRFMQEAVRVGEGSMAAILGMDRDEVKKMCEEVSSGEVLSIANINCPGQISIAGHSNAVNRMIERLRKEGKKAILLPVSAPYHSLLMKQAGERLANFLMNINIREANIPVVSNVDALPHTSSSEFREILIKQVSTPVRWEDSIRTMISLKIHRFVEIGPGKVLSGLLRRIDYSASSDNVEDVASIKKLKSIIEESRII